jgi:hypothetical protein
LIPVPRGRFRPFGLVVHSRYGRFLFLLSSCPLIPPMKQVCLSACRLLPQMVRLYPSAVCYRRWYGVWPTACYRRWFSGPLYCWLLFAVPLGGGGPLPASSVVLLGGGPVPTSSVVLLPPRLLLSLHFRSIVVYLLSCDPSFHISCRSESSNISLVV